MMSGVIDQTIQNLSACMVGWPSGRQITVQKQQPRQAKARPAKDNPFLLTEDCI